MQEYRMGWTKESVMICLEMKLDGRSSTIRGYNLFLFPAGGYERKRSRFTGEGGIGRAGRCRDMQKKMRLNEQSKTR